MTPHDYRAQKKNQILSWGEIADKTVSARFIHENSDFQLVEPNLAIDFLLDKDAKRYGRFCASLQNMGLAVALPKGGTLDEGFISVGDNGKGGIRLELWSDNFVLLSAWIHRFPEAALFYTHFIPSQVKEKLKESGIEKALLSTPQSLYTGDLIPFEMPADLCIRPMTYEDREHIVKWANGRQDGYIQHLLREKDYLDASVLEYGVFQGGDLIAIAGCGVDEVQGPRFNDCCQIRFAKGKESDAEYRLIFSYVVNDLLSKGILPYDELQHGEYACSHGNFTAADMGVR